MLWARETVDGTVVELHQEPPRSRVWIIRTIAPAARRALVDQRRTRALFESLPERPLVGLTSTKAMIEFRKTVAALRAAAPLPPAVHAGPEESKPC